MKQLILVCLLAGLATTLNAQTPTPTPSPQGETPAVATPDSQNPTAPVEGANSFTEEQAKGRIEAAGYAGVTGLKLDDKGIWQASATKDGKSVMVSLDYQGNVVAK
ncbi:MULTISPECIES: PepSY domain-containing protein [unclassified Ensifer]|uniref:PepSY domain-containing protein n=1 Tax=unclassified Ensifer TaxID=2633371 RepID=UPI00070ECA00|nr:MULTISPECIES: PepSY domain-containing protein [unclassified Ensifer]KQW61058.1 hypothetical protein ASD02_23285 [Ensifer sp. Root1252]KRC77963.1 hypothetical protein ASE32_27895 [Ensifer sp. Root231]KRD00383.1 hypothetical protein ASE47_23855 [Ensifer sp. Root258]